MAAMMSKLYAALRQANGVSDEAALAAAEEAYAPRDDIADLRSTQRLQTWILTFNTAMLIAIFVKTFFQP